MKKLLATLFLTGCATTTFISTNRYAIRMNVGTRGDSLYTGYMKDKALEVCPSGYEVVEKKKFDDKYLIWIVSCS